MNAAPDNAADDNAADDKAAHDNVAPDDAAHEGADQPSRLSTYAAGLIVLLIFLIPMAGFWWLRGVSRELVERSMLSHTRDMIFRHYARTGGQWPRSWDDLAEDFEPADAGYGTPSLEALQQVVAVDFAYDVTTIPEAKADHPPRVLWLKRQPDDPAVADANAGLMEALRARIAASETR